MTRWTVTLFLIVLTACGSLLDFTGKGAKTKCLYLSTEFLKLNCECSDKKIVTISIYENKDDKQNFGKLIYQNKLMDSLKQFTLPINRDSADKKFLQIEIHLSDSHWRETYYIDTKPGDISVSKNIYSRYFSH